MTEESARTTERQAAADGLASPDAPGMLSGLTVIEYADETAEYCGLLLAGLGAEVIKIEPPEGAPTRLIAPFRDEKIDKEQSLYFWAYNRGKRSAVLDLDSDEGKAAMLQLLAGADILLDSSSGGLNTQLGLARKSLAERFPSLIVARMTPFGDDGPWSSFKGSELRLRSKPGQRIRPPADRPANLARLSHRGRAASDRRPRRAHRTSLVRAWPGRLLRNP
jgi:crotonobetainyl-CoA:carnitine CoA-transferase CaiB-like acyl-CoA transferase